MAKPRLQIRMIQQGWLEGCSPEEDLCSHGRIRIVIGSHVITSGDEDYGVSESALALLRSLRQDHSSQKPIAQQLIFHGCGTMLMMGCPLGADWEVRHKDGHVRISNVVRHDGTSEAEVVKFLNVELEISEDEYRREVTAFAREAKTLFEGVPKTFADEDDQQEYERFWREYDLLLSDFGVAA